MLPVRGPPPGGNADTARGSKELLVGRGAPIQGTVSRCSLRLRTARWRMKKTNAPRTRRTQAMVMPTIAPVGRPCWVLTPAMPFEFAWPSVAEGPGLMAEAEATGAGGETTGGETTGGVGATGATGGEGATGAEGVVDGVVIGRPEKVSVGRSLPVKTGVPAKSEEVLELVVVTVVPVLIGITCVMVIGPVKVNALLTGSARASGAVSGLPWKGRRFLCRARSAGRRWRIVCIIVEGA